MVKYNKDPVKQFHCQECISVKNSGLRIPKVTSTMVTTERKTKTPQIFCGYF